MNNNIKPKFNTEKFINYVFHLLICCGVFLVLMIVSHTVIAQTENTNEITIAVFEDHQEQTSSSMPYGLSWKIIETVAEAENIELIKIATTWQSAINRLKDNRIDLVFAAFKTEERSQWADFTLPLASEYSALFNTIDNPTVYMEDIDFEREVVGVIANSTQETQARNIGFKHIYPTRERKQLVALLESGRINYVLLGVSTIKLYCPYQTACLQQVGEPLSMKYSRAMAMKNNPKTAGIITRLNERLAELYASRDMQELFREHKFSSEYYVDWKAKLESELIK